MLNRDSLYESRFKFPQGPARLARRNPARKSFASRVHRLDGAVWIVGKFAHLHRAQVGLASRQDAVVVEKVPLAFELHDRVMRGPADDGIEDTPAVSKRPQRRVAR